MTLFLLFVAMGISSIVIFIAIGALMGKKIYLHHYGMKEGITIDSLVMCSDCFSVIVVSEKSLWGVSAEKEGMSLLCNNCQSESHYLLQNLQVTRITKPLK